VAFSEVISFLLFCQTVMNSFPDWICCTIAPSDATSNPPFSHLNGPKPILVWALTTKSLLNPVMPTLAPAFSHEGSGPDVVSASNPSISSQILLFNDYLLASSMTSNCNRRAGGDNNVRR